jgi:hypothetical protein
MQMLGSLKDKPFHSQEEMRVGLMQALAGMQEDCTSRCGRWCRGRRAATTVS